MRHVLGFAWPCDSGEPGVYLDADQQTYATSHRADTYQSRPARQERRNLRIKMPFSTPK